jgi:hypothetical protein
MAVMEKCGPVVIGGEDKEGVNSKDYIQEQGRSFLTGLAILWMPAGARDHRLRFSGMV